MRNSLADITRLRERPKDGDLPDPTDEKKPPRKDLPQLSYGANKKYPHLSKAIEVTSEHDWLVVIFLMMTEVMDL